MRTMQRIQADLRNQGYDMSDWVGKTLYHCYDMPDQDLILPDGGW